MKLSFLKKRKITDAILHAEKQTSGEIRVHLSYAITPEAAPMQLAQEKFHSLNMHQTRDRNAVLLYINPKMRHFALFGDDGIHEKVGQSFWDDLSTQIRKAIQEKDITHGITHAVHEIGRALKHHFPHYEGQKDELKNDVTESD